jgi:hypothetical protein
MAAEPDDTRRTDRVSEPTPTSDDAFIDAKQRVTFRTRWEQLQSRFVDEPRDAVKGADDLVSEVLQRITSRFEEERRSLESQWDRGEDVSTEDLRVALQRYRSFFGRLLSA